MWYFVVFQPSKWKKTHLQPQIWSIWPIFPDDSESLPKVSYIKRKNSEILSKRRNSESAEGSALWPKCNPDLVFSCHGIPTHCDASDRPKCDKGFLNLLLPRVIVDATHVYSRIHGHEYFSSKMQVLHLLITATACCLWRYLVCCCWWAKVCFINTILMLT